MKHVLNNFQIFTCEAHESEGQTFANCTIANIYLNNQRKISTDAVVADGVRSFKKKTKRKVNTKTNQLPVTIRCFLFCFICSISLCYNKKFVINEELGVYYIFENIIWKFIK